MATTEDFSTTASTITYDYYSDDYNYTYDEDYTDEVCNKTEVNQFGANLTPVIFTMVVILSLFGNILVIVVLARYENLKSITNTFILNLAISDLFFTTGLPFWAYYHMYGWTFGDLWCKLVNFVFCVGFYSSGILLILMTVHRYASVIYPLSGVVSITGCYSVLSCVAVWVVSLLVASPAFIFVEVQNQNHCVYVNSYWSLWGIYQQNILFIVSSCVFVICYSRIILRLLRPTAQRRKNKTLKLIFMLMTVFFVGWAPYNIVIFLHSMHSWTKPPADSKTVAANCNSSEQLDYAFYICRLLAYMHCCLNPVFYVFVGVKFRSHLKKMLKGYSDSSNSTRSRFSRQTITSLTSGEEFSM